MAETANLEPVDQNSTLARILGALLCDAAKAQDISNWYSYKRLSPKYLEHIDKFDVPVPNGFLRELDIEFHLGFDKIVDDTDQGPQKHSDYAELLFGMVYQYVSKASDSVADLIQAHDSAEKKLCDTIRSPALKQYLHKHIRAALIGQLDRTKLEQSADFNSFFAQQLSAHYLKTLQDWLDRESYGESITDGKKGNNIVKQLSRLASDDIAHFDQTAEMALKELQQPTLAALIGSDIISTLNATATLRIRIEQRDLKWTVYIGKDEQGHEITKTRLLMENA